MTPDSSTKQLFKLLIAAAWIDGKIQVEERDYLHKMVQANSLAEDPEIRNLLLETQPIQPEQCYQWLEDYLGQNPSPEDYEKLLESLSALIYADDNVDIEEAKLLTHLQNLNQDNPSQQSVFQQLLKGIQKLYIKTVPMDK